MGARPGDRHSSLRPEGWLDAPGHRRFPLTTLTTDHKLDWFGTSRTRLGVLWTPNVLLYGTAGVAYGQVKDTATITAAGVGTSVTATFKDVKAGWTAGAGIEGRIGGGWTAKLEYLYIDLGKTEQTLAHAGARTGHFGDPSLHRQHRARRLQLPLGRRRLLIAV